MAVTECTVCGRVPDAADVSCRTCGVQVPTSAESTSAESTSAPERPTKPEANDTGLLLEPVEIPDDLVLVQGTTVTNPLQGQALRWLAAAGALVLLALGAVVLLRPDRAPAPVALPALIPVESTPTAVPAITPTPGPRVTPLAIRDGKVVLRNDGSPIGSQLAQLELGGYLVVVVDVRPLVYDLQTGDEVQIPAQIGGLSGVAGEVNRQGAISLGTFVPWDAADGSGSGRPIALEDGEVVQFIICCDPDPVAAVSQGFDADPEYLQNLSTGQRRSITSETGPITQVPRDERPWVFLYGSGGGDVHLVTSYADTVYQWSWESDWQAVGRGTVVATFANAVLVEVCDGPAQCERELRSADGSRRKLVDYGSRFHSVSTLSPDGRFFASLSLDDDVPGVSVIDMDTSPLDPDGGPRFIDLDLARSDNFLGFATPTTWIGDRHLLVGGHDVAGPVLVNVETGDQTRLGFLERAAGIQPRFIWLPELIGLREG